MIEVFVIFFIGYYVVPDSFYEYLGGDNWKIAGVNTHSVSVSLERQNAANKQIFQFTQEP